MLLCYSSPDCLLAGKVRWSESGWHPLHLERGHQHDCGSDSEPGYLYRGQHAGTDLCHLEGERRNVFYTESHELGQQQGRYLRRGTAPGQPQRLQPGWREENLYLQRDED